MRLRGGSFFWKIVNKQLKNVKSFRKLKKLPPLIHILALPTQGQKCTIFEVQPINFVIFQMEHPVKIQVGIWWKRMYLKILITRIISKCKRRCNYLLLHVIIYVTLHIILHSTQCTVKHRKLYNSITVLLTNVQRFRRPILYIQLK